VTGLVVLSCFVVPRNVVAEYRILSAPENTLAEFCSLRIGQSL
jgi:hypothetical protein